MNVTRDVIMDLLALVRAGEASADSRALVESCLERDPELARIAKAQVPRLSQEHAPAPVGKEVEMRTLERTKKLLNWRSAAIAAGVFFGLFPVYFSAGSGGARWLPLESPAGAAISAALAIVGWGTYFWIRRSLRARRP